MLLDGAPSWRQVGRLFVVPDTSVFTRPTDLAHSQVLETRDWFSTMIDNLRELAETCRQSMWHWSERVRS